MRIRRGALLLVLASMPVVAWAGNAGGVSSNATEKTFTGNTAQIALLKQQAEIAKLKAKITAAKNGAVGNGQQRGGIGSGRLPPGTIMGSKSRPAARPSEPEIVSIVGVGTRVRAVLMLPNGSEVVASRGEALPDGMTVHDVSANGVRVMKGGNLIPLAFATSTRSPNVEAGTRPSDRPRLPPGLPGAGGQ